MRLKQLHITTNEMFTMPNIYCNPENHSSVPFVLVTERGSLVGGRKKERKSCIAAFLNV